MGRLTYRVRQFIEALTAPLASRQMAAELDRTLSPQQRALFEKMPAVDRHHAYRVYQVIRAQGSWPRGLLLASLLHDVGKTALPSPLWVRVAAVLLGSSVPGDSNERSGRHTGLWDRIVAYQEHAQVGAELAAQAGCPPLAVSLIRRHHEPLGRIDGAEDEMLALLQKVDGSL